MHNDTGDKLGPPPWSEAPDWANWVVMDADGKWKWMDVTPLPADGVWNPMGGLGAVVCAAGFYDCDPPVNWRYAIGRRDDWDGHVSPCAMHSYEDESPHDPVNRPSHYTNGDIECIDAIRAALTDEEFRGFCKGNNIKYTWRERMKGGNQDMRKARWYLQKLEQESDE